jgi:hypothetical protein
MIIGCNTSFTSVYYRKVVKARSDTPAPSIRTVLQFQPFGDTNVDPFRATVFLSPKYMSWEIFLCRHPACPRDAVPYILAALILAIIQAGVMHHRLLINH